MPTREDVADMDALDSHPKDKDMIELQSLIAEIFAKVKYITAFTNRRSFTLSFLNQNVMLIS